MNEKEKVRWADWLLGPDIELVINKKTRLSAVLFLISALGLVVFWSYFVKGSPFYWFPVGFSVSLLVFGIKLYFEMDELLQRIFQDASLLTLVVVCGSVLIIKPWLTSYFSFVTVDVFLISLASVFCIAVFIFYRFKL